MSFRELSPETLQAIASVAQAMGATSFTVTTPRICDHCQFDGREAFPYYVKDIYGREWAHLCNPCFDLLGCTYID